MSGSPSSHWDIFHRYWARLGPPLRPHAQVVDALGFALAGHASRVLLLGVTPELANIGSDVTAIECNAGMIAHLWPGDTSHRRAHRGDWRELPCPDHVFSAVVGDLVLNSIAYPESYRAVFTECLRVLQPGGIFATRVSLRPDEGETVASVLAEGRTGRIRVFNTFKMRLIMAIIAEAHDPNLAVTTIRDVFNRTCPDRRALSAQTGWMPEDIETIDAYENSSAVYSYPTVAELRATIPGSFSGVHFVAAGDYALAERYPLLVMRA